ncbi:MAG: hypothetical protein A3I68_03645 [Candidatus Melainabacteria bacterium RIFCSPLOWO2_02_FULL_35_15]|nr:MAG: hypothetical protein A3F80_03960 [Candidatus Melainabacteria bacterium RIFCSPLOWO2_12_FULL_35_11]OGI14694.1 MAG: hypothetical protein A3I68_03645 [Candidatus Melainabacteria bacterium RIFCSPLOWO2_02_FULL_35_15]
MKPGYNKILLMKLTTKLIVLLFSVILSLFFLSYFSNSIAKRDANTSEPLILAMHEPNQITKCTLNQWFNPAINDEEGVRLLKNCSHCHMAGYKEWINDKHSMSQSNPFFLSIYSGTDKEGNENIAPGFRLDHPKQNGNCILCHNPEAALDNNFDIDLRNAENTNGISCNFCHKIESIDKNHLKQGVRGLTISRVCKGQKEIGFGPLNDLVESTDIVEFKYNPIYKESLYCAKCHDGFQGNTQIYSTFTEWLNSPAKKQGIQCQSCHMPVREHTAKKIHIVDNPDVKSKLRPYYQLHSHSFLTNNPHKFRKTFLDLKIKVKVKNNILKVTAKVINKNTGHSFPTGSPMRNALLVLEVKDENNNKLELIKGPQLPVYAGSLKGKPGRLFAKILSETSNQYAQTHGEDGIRFRKTAGTLGIPAQQWWNIFILSDTRIKALKNDISIYEFFIEPHRKISVTAKLIWRNTWPGLAKVKEFIIKEETLIEKTLLL